MTSGIETPQELDKTGFLIRAVENRLLGLFAEGKLNGTVHSCLGQECTGIAARWCVKEALKKCDNAFMDIGMSQIEVISEPSGNLKLRVSTSVSSIDIPHSVSVSHNPLMAAAVVVTVPS
jgi:phosphopantetheinyl transferase (holo-ACP synthase)